MLSFKAVPVDARRNGSPWVFASRNDHTWRVWWEAGIGCKGFGFLRAQWWHYREQRPAQRIAFKSYSGTATHLTIGPLVLSYVNDREGHGPIGPVYRLQVSR